MSQNHTGSHAISGHHLAGPSAKAWKNETLDALCFDQIAYSIQTGSVPLVLDARNRRTVTCGGSEMRGRGICYVWCDIYASQCNGYFERHSRYLDN
jgi:hypothetical protein